MDGVEEVNGCSQGACFVQQPDLPERGRIEILEDQDQQFMGQRGQGHDAMKRMCQVRLVAMVASCVDRRVGYPHTTDREIAA